MNIQEYIEKRVDDQINWYDEKSRKAQKWYKGLQLLEIIIAALIPLLSGYTEHSYIRNVKIPKTLIHHWLIAI